MNIKRRDSKEVVNDDTTLRVPSYKIERLPSERLLGIVERSNEPTCRRLEGRVHPLLKGKLLLGGHSMPAYRGAIRQQR